MVSDTRYPDENREEEAQSVDNWTGLKRGGVGGALNRDRDTRKKKIKKGSESLDNAVEAKAPPTLFS